MASSTPSVIDLLYCSSLRNWCNNFMSRRCLLPFEIISFPANSDFAKYLIDDDCNNGSGGCKNIPSDSRLHIQDPWSTTAATKQDFDDETIMERQAGWDDKIKDAFNNNNNNNTNNSDSQQNQKTPSFSKYVDKVEAAMKKIGNLQMVAEGVCVTGAFGTIDDAGWALPSNTPSCVTLNDVFTTLVTSTKIVKDLKKQRELIEMLKQEKKDLRKNNDDGEDEDEEDQNEEFHLYFALRPWLEVSPGTEFRVFVEGRKIIGICQRHMDLLFSHLFPFAVSPSIEETNTADNNNNNNNNNSNHNLSENEEDEENTAGAFSWSYQIEKLLTENVIETNPEVENFVIDIIHPGPESLHLPLHIVGVEALSNQDFQNAATKNNSNKNGNEKKNMDEKTRQEDTFRLFGNYEGLKYWESVVDAFLSHDQVISSASSTHHERFSSIDKTKIPSTLIRIATNSEDLFKDNRAAQRGGIPLEFLNQELYQQTVEAIQEQQMKMAQDRIATETSNNNTSYQVSGTQALEDILKTRTSVHGVEHANATSTNKKQ